NQKPRYLTALSGLMIVVEPGTPTVVWSLPRGSTGTVQISSSPPSPSVSRSSISSSLGFLKCINLYLSGAKTDACCFAHPAATLSTSSMALTFCANVSETATIPTSSTHPYVVVFAPSGDTLTHRLIRG